MPSKLVVNLIGNTISTKSLSLGGIRSLSFCQRNISSSILRTTSISPHGQIVVPLVCEPLNFKLNRNQSHVLQRHFQTTNLCNDGKHSGASSTEGNSADEILKTQLKKEQTENKAKDDPDAQQEEERKRTVKALKFSIYTLSGMLVLGLGSAILVWGTPQRAENGDFIDDEFSEMPILQQYLCRAYKEGLSVNKMMQEPIRDKLLPDPLQYPYIQPRMTLVLELKDVLVHPEWTYSSGWRFKKRPGVDFLLQHCAPPLFEIIIFSKEQAMTAYPVVEKLDKQGAIWYKLFKEATRYENGKHYKDLHCLNRDLNKVIAIDWDQESHTSQRNVLHLDKWDGDMEDQTLVELAIMLRTIAESEVEDVREVLDYYRTFDDPIAAFKENQRVAKQQEEERKKFMEEQAQSRGLLSSFRRSFGPR